MHKVAVDPILPERALINLAPRPRIEMARYTTLETLDMGMRRIMDIRGFSAFYRDYPARPMVLDLVPPFDHIPYGALDLRR